MRGIWKVGPDSPKMRCRCLGVRHEPGESRESTLGRQTRWLRRQNGRLDRKGRVPTICSVWGAIAASNLDTSPSLDERSEKWGGNASEQGRRRRRETKQEPTKWRTLCAGSGDLAAADNDLHVPMIRIVKSDQMLQVLQLLR